MSDLKDLYQEVIIDHSRNPRNFKTIKNADCSANGSNPLCGDELVLFLKFQNHVIQDVSSKHYDRYDS